MSLPTPVPELVLRYNYLWATEAANGQVEASKERPAAIVMTMAHGDAGQTRVYALPITHAVPAEGTEAKEKSGSRAHGRRT